MQITSSKPTRVSVMAASFYLVLFFTVAAITQLFWFESYPELIMNYGWEGVSGYALLLAALIVSLEVLALPSLLSIKLSSLMRGVSMVSAWLVLMYWLGVGVWQIVVNDIPNAGLFGAKMMSPQGWWLVGYVVVLIGLLAYVSVNMPKPGNRKK